MQVVVLAIPRRPRMASREMDRARPPVGRLRRPRHGELALYGDSVRPRRDLLHAAGRVDRASIGHPPAFRDDVSTLCMEGSMCCGARHLNR